MYMYKEDLALNNLQRLIWHKTKPFHVYLIYMYKTKPKQTKTEKCVGVKTER